MRMFNIYNRSFLKSHNVGSSPNCPRVPKTQRCCRIFQMFEENTDKPYISDTNKPLFWCNREYITSCYIPFDDYLYEARFGPVPMIKKIKYHMKTNVKQECGWLYQSISQVWKGIQYPTRAHISLVNNHNYLTMK